MFLFSKNNLYILFISLFILFFTYFVFKKKTENKYKYKYILFDADGTLYDSISLIIKCFQYVCKKYKKDLIDSEQSDGDISKNELIRKYNVLMCPLQDGLENLFPECSKEKIDKIKEDFSSFQLKSYKKEIKLFDDVKYVLRKLKQKGSVLGVVSSRKKKSLDEILEVLDIAKYFEVILGPESTKRPKPFADPIVNALSILGCDDKNKAIYIGDMPTDIETGINALVDTVFVNWSVIKHEELESKPTYAINNFKDILSLVV